MILLLGFFLALAASRITAFCNPSARVLLRDARIGDGSHQGEKFATNLFAIGVGIVGCCLAFKRPVPGYGLIGTSYLLESVRCSVFQVWEGGRLFDREFLVPWIFLMTGVLMFGAAVKEHQRRGVARAALEEVN